MVFLLDTLFWVAHRLSLDERILICLGLGLEASLKLKLKEWRPALMGVVSPCCSSSCTFWIPSAGALQQWIYFIPNITSQAPEYLPPLFMMSSGSSASSLMSIVKYLKFYAGPLQWYSGTKRSHRNLNLLQCDPLCFHPVLKMLNNLLLSTHISEHRRRKSIYLILKSSAADA